MADDRPTEADNLRQMLRFHMDRAERHRLRAETVSYTHLRAHET